MISFHDEEHEHDHDRNARTPLDRAPDADLDDEFPLGDGTAETESVVICPYCGELNEIALDPGSGALQQYVEDCQVCCQPWQVTVRYDAQGDAHVAAEPMNEA